MKPLTKTAIIATSLCLVYFYLSLQVSRTVVTNGKRAAAIVLWHIPFYRYVQLPGRSWSLIVGLWLVSVVIPPILWVTVGVKHFFAKPSSLSS